MRDKIKRRLAACRRDDESGYVMVFVALTLTLMLIFAAFTVDFGSWYDRSLELKRGADAAALAGVVWMPEFDLAQQYALEAATKNGFTNGVNNISVVVSQIPNNNRQLKVTITDSRAKQFFSKVITQSQSIGRASTAEYVLPVPLGSPENVFGTGDLVLPSQLATQNFWAAVNGYCAGHESGDPKLGFWESYQNNSSNPGCNNGSAANTDDYDPLGYLYAIDLPANSTSLKLDVYDGDYNRSGSTMDIRLGGTSTSESVTTTYQIYDRNPTPLDQSNLTLLSTVNVTTNDATYQNQWKNLYTWNSPLAGRYYVRVKTPVQTTNSRASNGFALRAFTGASFSTCSTIVGQSNFSASCPQLHAVSDMSIYANLSGAATFYLAQIDPVHAGKTMRINLFDAGEGASQLEILDPNGNPTSFTWTTPCSPQTPPYGGCSGSGTALAVADAICGGTCPQPYSGLNSSSKYSDRFMTIDIPLPSNYSTVYGTKVWWKIRYTLGSSSTDRTTWSVNIVGDPVHLLH